MTEEERSRETSPHMEVELGMVITARIRGQTAGADQEVSLGALGLGEGVKGTLRIPLTRSGAGVVETLDAYRFLTLLWVHFERDLLNEQTPVGGILGDFVAQVRALHAGARK